MSPYAPFRKHALCIALLALALAPSMAEAAGSKPAVKRSAPRVTATTSWTSTSTYRGEETGSGCFSQYFPRQIAGQVVKTLSFPENLTSSPVAWDELLYVNGAQTVYALDPVKGALAWGARVNGTPTTPAFSGKNVYFATDVGGLYALNAQTGKVLWQRKNEKRAFVAPLLTYQNRLYVFDRQGTLTCFDGATGRSVWSYRTGQPTNVSPLAAGGLIFASGAQNRLVALAPATGTVRWRGIDGKVSQMPTWLNGVVYAGGEDGIVRAARIRRAAPLWKSKTFGPLASPFVPRDKLGWSVTTDGLVFALDIRQGKPRWQTRLPAPVKTALTVTPMGSQIFVMTENGTLYALAGATGKGLWKIDFDSPNATTPMLWNGCLWVPHGEKLTQMR